MTHPDPTKTTGTPSGLSAPPTPAALERFFGRLRRASRRALLLDYDGTIAPFSRAVGSEAGLWSGVGERLAALMRGGTHVAIVTGRRAEAMPPLLALDPLPEIWGSHGRECLACDGRLTVQACAPEEEAALETARLAVTALGLEGACLLKPGCLTYSMRGASGARLAEARVMLAEVATGVTSDHGELAWRHFHGGIEIFVRGIDKGRAVRECWRRMTRASAGASASAGAGGAVLAFLGDDVTDEDGFRAAAELGEAALGVLVRPEWATSAARAWLRPPEGLLEFLDRWSETQPGESSESSQDGQDGSQ